MFQVSFDVAGLEGIEDALERLTEERLLAAAAEGMEKGLQEIAAIAKAEVPEDTGELRGSIKAESVKISGGAVTGKVKAAKDYAVYVEMGTGPKGFASNTPGAIEANATYHTGSYMRKGKMVGSGGQKAQPYMYPAMKQGEHLVKEHIAAAIKKAVSG